MIKDTLNTSAGIIACMSKEELGKRVPKHVTGKLRFYSDLYVHELSSQYISGTVTLSDSNTALVTFVHDDGHWWISINGTTLNVPDYKCSMPKFKWISKAALR